MSQTYRVRYSLKPASQPHTGADVMTADLQTDLDNIPRLLPPGAYIMYVEDLTIDRAVHWTRWPSTYRPGFENSPGESR
jgi:hypothetical protein